MSQVFEFLGISIRNTMIVLLMLHYYILVCVGANSCGLS